MKIPIKGLIKLEVNDLTMVVNAEPMITPTAKSKTLPLEMNALNSLNKLQTSFHYVTTFNTNIKNYKELLKSVYLRYF